MNLYNLAMLIEETPSPPPEVLVTGHFHVNYGYVAHRSHGSGNWLLTYTLDGQGCFQQDEVELRADPGDIVLLSPGTGHDYSVPPGGVWEFLWAHFQPRLEWFSWWSLPQICPGIFQVHLQSQQARERVRLAFLKLHADACAAQTMPHDSPFSDMHTNSFLMGNGAEPFRSIQRDLALNGLEEIFLLAARENIGGKLKQLDGRVQQVLDIMLRDLASPHDLDSLAKLVVLSPSRLAHLFKQEVGNSVTATLLHLRLKQAARLLEWSSRSISEIAEEVGFRSGFYFSRQFRQRFGASPSEYRTACWKHV